MNLLKHHSNFSIQVLHAMIVGTILGIVINLFFSDNLLIKNYITNGLLDIGGQFFIRLLKMIVVPVVFVSLVLGICNIQDIKKLGRIGIKTFILYISTTVIAIILALIIANIIKPGINLNLKLDKNFTPSHIPSLKDTIINIISDNPIKSMAEGNMLQIIVFSILLGISIALVSQKQHKLVIDFFESLNTVVLNLVHIVIKFAPIGVICLISKVFANQGFSAFVPLAKYFFCVIFILLLQLFGTYYLMIKFLAKLNPIVFFKKIKDLMIFAFSTSSSNATIPVSLDTCINKLGISKTISSFSIPLGATINMDGTSIMQAVATVFIAQAYNIDIGFHGYLLVVFTATLASIGTAGVPSVGLVTLVIVLEQVNLPVEGIGLIMGVDRLLDMCRTAVNVSGDITVACIVAKQEKELDIQKFYST